MNGGFYGRFVEKLEEAIRCDVHLDTLLHVQMNVLNFTGYGADAIKTFKISPDAFVQMALQLAVFKMTGGS